jgi:hypothetical protein
MVFREFAWVGVASPRLCLSARVVQTRIALMPPPVACIGQIVVQQITQPGPGEQMVVRIYDRNVRIDDGLVATDERLLETRRRARRNPRASRGAPFPRLGELRGDLAELLPRRQGGLGFIHRGVSYWGAEELPGVGKTVLPRRRGA